MSTSGSRPSPPARGPMGMMGGPPAKALNFKGSLRRLVARLRVRAELVLENGRERALLRVFGALGRRLRVSGDDREGRGEQ